MPIPDFFIIGAPKCGTTSLADWLSQHPGIFMCRPKEPHYYSPELVAYPAARSKVEYENLFADARSCQIIGEASTGYLRSKNAVPRILEDNPTAKLIVCLRNPIDMAPSVHAQLLQGGRAIDEDFEKSWNKQELVSEAAERETIVSVCRLGAQVERLLQLASHTQVMFLLLDDLKSAPRATYEHVLRFIGAPYDESAELRVLNKRAHPRSLVLARVASYGWRIKRKMGVSKSLGMGSLIAKYNRKPLASNQSRLSPETRRSLQCTFSNEINLLERLIGRDLSQWRDELR